MTDNVEVFTLDGSTVLNEPQCTSAEVARKHTFDPIKEWLLANGVDLHKTPSWPEIEIRRELQSCRLDAPPVPDTLRVQQFVYRQKQEFRQSALVKMGNHLDLPTRMAEFPLLVALDDGLWAEYPKMRERAQRAQIIDALGSAGATVIHAAEGDRLLFVTSTGWGNPAEADAARDMLRKAFPGVEILLMGGCDVVVKGRRES